MSVSPEIVARAMYHATKGEGAGHIMRVDAPALFSRPSAAMEYPTMDAMMAGMHPARDDSSLHRSQPYSRYDYT
jgi:hypothetical protein